MGDVEVLQGRLKSVRDRWERLWNDWRKEPFLSSKNIANWIVYNLVPPLSCLCVDLKRVGSVSFRHASSYEHFNKVLKRAYWRTSTSRGSRMQGRPCALDCIVKILEHKKRWRFNSWISILDKGHAAAENAWCVFALYVLLCIWKNCYRII